MTGSLPGAGAILLLLVLASHDLAAQPLFKCEAGGAISYTENQCPPGAKQEMLPPPPAALHPDLDTLCSPSARSDHRRDVACRAMLSCRDHDRSNCFVYCSGLFQPQFPELHLGPTSPTCLKLTGRLRGDNWVQAASRAMLAGGYEDEAFTFYCVDSRGTAFPQHHQLFCKRGTTDCGRDRDQPLATLASSICKEKYGTQLSPTVPWQPPSFLSSQAVPLAGAGGAVALLAGAVLLYRRRRKSGSLLP